MYLLCLSHESPVGAFITRLYFLEGGIFVKRPFTAIVEGMVIALLVVSFLAFPAQARVATAALSHGSHAVTPDAVPNSNIVGKGKPVFKPNQLTCNVSDKPAFTIKNKT